MLSMASDCHSEFYVLSDVPACIAGAVGIVYGNGDSSLLSLKLVLLHEASVDGAAHAATIKKALHGQRLGSGYGVQDDFK